MTQDSKQEPVRIDRPERRAAEDFCRGLSRTLGGAFRVGLYDLDPPRLLETWGPRSVLPEDPVPALISEAGRAEVINRPVGRSRVSILPLPAARGAPHFAAVVEANTAALARAANLLAALVDPDISTRAEGPAHVGEALQGLLAESEARVGVSLGQMSRSQKQEVVKYLDERGAFLLKKAVEQVAERLGVSRFTIYNYLDGVKREE